MKLGHAWRTGCTVATTVSRERRCKRCEEREPNQRRETEGKIINNHRLFSPPVETTIARGVRFDRFDSNSLPRRTFNREREREARVARDSIIVSSGIPYREGDARDLERGA